MKYIKNLNLVLTFKCNLKCKHCDIWINKDNSNIDISTLFNIINDKKIISSYNYYEESFEISLSGGEIFLIPNINNYLTLIQNNFPKALICITTNGILTQNIISFIYKLKNKKHFKINISIDGIKNIHDKQRGVKGSFEKSLETIILIKRLFPQILIEIKFTITKFNYKYIYSFTKLANKLKVFFSFKPYENITNYTNKIKDIKVIFSKDEINIIKNQIFNNKYIKKQDYYKSHLFFYKIPEYLEKGLTKKEKSMCNINKYDFEIMPNLDIYSCILLNKIGNLKNNNIDDILKGEKFKKQIKKISSGKCPGCLLMCGSAKTKQIFKIKENEK